MTYYTGDGLGIAAQDLRSRIIALSSKRISPGAQEAIRAATAAPAPTGVVAMPTACAALRIPSFDMWDTVEPPTTILPGSGLMMFIVKMPPSFDTKYPKSHLRQRTEALLEFVNGIKRSMRPLVPRWDVNGDWWERAVGKLLAESSLIQSHRISRPDGTVWKLDWNKSGPAHKEARHITSINSMPDGLYRQMVGVQGDPNVVKGLSLLRATHPGPSGVLPMQGVVWWTVEVLRKVHSVKYEYTGGRSSGRIRGFQLMNNTPLPVQTKDLTRWMASIASGAMRAQRLGSLAVPIPAWIPDIRPTNINAPETEYNHSDWRNENLRRSLKNEEDQRVRQAGYAHIDPHPERGTPAPLTIKYQPIVAGKMRSMPLGIPVVLPATGQDQSDPNSMASTFINIGLPDSAVEVPHYGNLSEPRNREFYTKAQIDKLYDIASVMGDSLVDMLAPLMSQSLIGPKTSREVEGTYRAWIGRANQWAELHALVRSTPTIIQSALASGAQAEALTADNPVAAMTAVTGAISLLEGTSARISSLAMELSQSEYSAADVGAMVMRDAAASLVMISRGLQTALSSLRERTRPGATESQRLHMTCLLYKKANREGKEWPDKYRQLAPVVQRVHAAAVGALPLVPEMLGLIAEALDKLRFIQDQIELPWWMRQAGPLPVWAWGAIGGTAFLGSAFGARKLRQRMRAKKKVAPVSKKARLLRKTSR